LDRSISTNINNLKALNLKAVVLRKLGKCKAAEQQVTMVTVMDPLDHQAKNELVIIKLLVGWREEANQILNELKKIMRDDVYSYLELALSYSNSGFYDEAIDVLSRLEKIGIKYPMIFYYLGYYWAKNGDKNGSLNYYAIANKMPYDYCFPFFAEDIEVLKHALAIFPGNARPHYYLGNLLYEYQPENAIVEWEKARDLDSTFYIVHRNLGLAYEQVEKNVPKAIASMEKAILCNNSESRLFYELDVLYEKGKVLLEKRLEVLERNHDIVAKRDDALSREAHICILLGKYAKAIDIMTQNHFNRWEGSSLARFLYEDAHLLRGLQYFKNGNYVEALKDYEATPQYPKNLDIGKPPEYVRLSQIYYFMGRAYYTLGKKEKAQEYFEKAVANKAEKTEYAYYQGLAYQELGNLGKAEKIFDDLMDFAQKGIKINPFSLELKNIEMAEKHFLIGLAYLGKNLNKKAETEFNNVLELHPDHVWAREHLKTLERA
jgi:tetratricopeptide (TPR) repeat protein